jgi:hypothetical protein
MAEAPSTLSLPAATITGPTPSPSSRPLEQRDEGLLEEILRNNSALTLEAANAMLDYFG